MYRDSETHNKLFLNNTSLTSIVATLDIKVEGGSFSIVAILSSSAYVISLYRACAG